MAKLETASIDLDFFSEKYNARFEKVDGDIQSKLCIACGKTTSENGSYVWIIDGGDSLATADETDYDESADMGWWNVGSECIKAVPENFRLKM